MDTVQAMRERDATTEILILREKLAESDAKLELVGGAVLESVYRMHNTMRRLLTANDVTGNKAMRENILEQMNDMGRDVVRFFNNKGLVSFNDRDVWPPTGKMNASHHQ